MRCSLPARLWSALPGSPSSALATLLCVTVAVFTAGCATGPLGTGGPGEPAGVAAIELPSLEPAPPAPPALPADPVPASAAASAPAADLASIPESVPRDPLPRARLDPAQDAERSDLWERVRSGFVLPDLDDDLVRKWEQYYAGRPDYVQRMTERGGRYLFHIVEEVARRNMPAELALLPFIESAFNPQAMSTAAASGMWQFMPATGRDFELRQNLFRDDRRDVLASTRAALDYLQRLHALFGDWQLALAAYNWGQGNVLKAIERNRRAGLPLDYSALRMPEETRNYVPKLQAVENIVQRPEVFALTLPVLENHPFFLSVAIERDIDVDVAARLSGLPLAEFQALNPQMNKPVILAAGTPQVLLPYDNANRFLVELPRHRGALASWTAWVAPRTLSVGEVARQVGVPEALLREVNRIPARMLVKTGSALLVPRGAAIVSDVSEHLADNATMALAPEAPPLRRVGFRVGKRGDSVAAVARRYRIAPALVASWNDVGMQAAFKPGQQVVVMLPALSARRSVAASRAPRTSRGVAGRETTRAAPPRASPAQRR